MTQKQGFQYQWQPTPSGEPMFDYHRGGNEPWDHVKQRALGEAQTSLRGAKAKGNLPLARGWQVVHDKLLARTEADALAATTRSPGSSITGFTQRAWQDTDPAEHRVFVNRTPQNEPFWDAFYKLDVAKRPDCLQQIGRAGPGGATVDRTTQISEAQAYASLEWAWQQPGWNDEEPPLTVRKVVQPTP
jgi:hypothetical protein